MSAPFNNVSCGSLRPFPLHAARVRVRGALFFGDFLWPDKESHLLPGSPGNSNRRCLWINPLQLGMQLIERADIGFRRRHHDIRIRA